MHTYDPTAGIVYVRMARDTDAYAVPVTSAGRHNRLPSGYANKSLRTRLSGCTAPGSAGVEKLSQ